MFKDYLLQNWALILILLAFVISLATTVFFDKKTIARFYILIGAIFLLSIVVFFEFHKNVRSNPDSRTVRNILMAVRYSATPLIIAQIGLTLVKRLRWFIFIPALALMVLNIVSIFTGIVSIVDETNTLVRGPLWLSPYIAVGLYSVFLIYLLIARSNKKAMEIIPIAFMAFALASGLILPFILQADYASIFCIIIAIAVFVYYEFTVIQLTKKDSLTGLLNRHAYFADINNDPKSISALISIDMNGLKKLNDGEGHQAGDDALVTLALCFNKALSYRQTGYRVGGDEFIIVCRKTPKEETLHIVESIQKYVSETKYTCSIGYSFNPDGNKSINTLLKESDDMMYLDKQTYYRRLNNDRRRTL